MATYGSDAWFGASNHGFQLGQSTGTININCRHPAPQIPRFHNRYYEIPRNPSSAFTERNDVYTRLQEVCLPSNGPDSPPQQRRFVLYGLGGSGKTQLCLKFAEEHREKFWGIFWIDASSEENIERGLVNITAVCGLAGDANSVKRWLSNVPERWLVIFDNADDPRLDLSRYFPVGARGTILITTRNPDCRGYAAAGSSWELGRMEVDEAITLILKTSDVNNLSDQRTRDMAKPVVLSVECLALAVAQAGAVIRQGVCGMAEYCELYSQRRQELLSQNIVWGGEDYQYTVYTTWEISLRVIEGMPGDAAKDAVKLLQIFSFLHHDGISEEMFHRAWTGLWDEKHSNWIKKYQLRILFCQRFLQWDPQPFRKALSILSSFSLINWDKNGLVSIHPLVHTWARDRLSRSDEEEIWISAVSTIAMSIQQIFQTADYRFRRALVPHMDACLGFYDDGIFHLQAAGNECLSECLSMAEKFARAYQENGRQQDALELLERVATMRKETQREEHPDTLASIHRLAILYSKMGRRKEALQLLEKVVAARKKTLGEEHPDTLVSMHDLAIRYSDMGQREEALQLIEKVVAASKRILGEEHPDTLVSIHDLANIYSDMGQREEALQLIEKVVAASKRTLGEEHPSTLSSMHVLASIYSYVGQRDEALQLIENVVTAKKRTLGEEHPDTLVSMHVLVSIYSEVGQREEALQLIEKVAATSKRTLGEEHPNTLASMHNLAICYSDVGQREEALQLIEKVVTAKKKTMGEEHSNTLVSMHFLANIYSEMGQREEALQLIEKVVAASKRTLGEEHPGTLTSMHALANIYSEVGQREEALQLIEKVVAARKRTLREEHPDILVSMHVLASIYSEVGQREEALQLLEKVVAASKRTLGEEHPGTLASMHALAIRYSEVGQREEALQLIEKVVAARKRTLGEEHSNTLVSMHVLANIYSDLGQREEALQLIEKVVAASKRTLGEEHPGTLTSMHDLANIYSYVGQREEALQLIENVVAARKRTLGEEHPDTLLSQHTLTILRQGPSTSAKAPWQHSKKKPFNHNPDKLKRKQKTSTSRFWRKFI